MKTIGLLGGMSWQSTVTYYQLINQGVQSRLGGLHSAQILMSSIDFAPMEALQQQGDWHAAGEILVKAAQSLEQAGAQGLMICTNTMHKVAEQVQDEVQIPLLHIADATGEELVAQGVRTVALLGTAFTMEQDFYKSRLKDKFGLKVLVPESEQRALIHRVIYDELCQGVIEQKSRNAYLDIIGELAHQGAQTIILGCTEIGLLIDSSQTDIQLLDTTAVHAQAAVDFIL